LFEFTALTNNNGFNFIGAGPNANTNIFAVNTSQLTVNGDNGNVNIGSSLMVGSTTAPTARFHLKSASRGSVALRVTDSDTTNDILRSGSQPDGDGFLQLRTVGGAGNVLFDASGDSYVNGGNFGIGTTNFVTTGAKLQVKGTSATPATSGSNFTGSIFSVEGTSTVNISMGTTGASSYYGWIQAHDAGTGTNYKLNLNPLGGNVGIGESIPTEKLHVGGNIKMQASTAIVTYQNAVNTWNVGLDAADASFKFKDGTDERARLTSGGDLLVGKTSTSVTSVGIEARNIGLLAVNRDNATPVYFGRQTSYGHLIEFRKETSIVGKLGIESSGFYIDGEGSHSGLKFTSAGITPRLNGAGSDNTVNLGESGIRFKDIFLSGKVTAANIYNAAGSEVMDLSNADSTIINDPEGVSGLYIGDSGQPDNYYSNTTHTFTGRNLTDIHAIIDTTGIKSLGDYKVGSQTVIDASRNLTNIGTISSGAITSSGTITTQANSAAAGINIKRSNAGSGGSKGFIAFRDVNDKAVASIFSVASGGDNNGNLRFETSASADQSDPYSLSTALTLDTSQNATFAGTISSGAITATGAINSTGTGRAIQVSGITRINSVGDIIGTSYYIGGTNIIDTSRNLVNIVNASTSKLTLVGSSSANIENYVTGTGTPTTNWRTVGASSNLMTLGSSGGLNIAGSLTQNSDRRIKDNIAPITDALSKTCALQGSTYTRTDKGQDTAKVHAGLIAQDVEAVLPEAVGETNDIKTIDYSSVVALLVESIKELKSEVDDLKTQLSQKEK
jgi:hypothetical protein